MNDFPFIVLQPERKWIIERMEKSLHEDYNRIADISLSLDNDLEWVETDKLIEDQVFRDRTHAFLFSNEGVINGFSYLQKKYGHSWYRSTETVLSEYPYYNWQSKRRWPLNEQLNLHIMNYQEVTLKPDYTLTSTSTGGSRELGGTLEAGAS